MTSTEASSHTNIPSLKSLLKLKQKYDAPTTEELPVAYKRNTDVEKLYCWAVESFRSQVRHKFPNLQAKCILAENECGVHKLIPTFIRPTALPFSHLFDVDACAQFVSDFIFYQPKRPFLDSPVYSPTHTLATQIGNSLEMSQVLVSLLKGFGFQAYVVCGRVEKKIASMNTSSEACTLLSQAETNSPHSAARPGQHHRSEPESEPMGLKYSVAAPPLLESQYQAFVEELHREHEEAREAEEQPRPEQAEAEGEVLKQSQEEPDKKKQKEAVEAAEAAAATDQAGQAASSHEQQQQQDCSKATDQGQAMKNDLQQAKQAEGQGKEGGENDQQQSQEAPEAGTEAGTEEGEEGEAAAAAPPPPGKKEEQDNEQEEGKSSSGEGGEPAAAPKSAEKQEEAAEGADGNHQPEEGGEEEEEEEGEEEEDEEPQSFSDPKAEMMEQQLREEQEAREAVTGVWHAWVYIHHSDAPFFIETTTGERISLNHEGYKAINSVWDDENYWLSKHDTAPEAGPPNPEPAWKRKLKLDLQSNDDWIKFAADFNVDHNPSYQCLLFLSSSATFQQLTQQAPTLHCTKRLLKPLRVWLKELQVPRDSFELMYHLGQRVQYFARVKVEYFAPYLLKDGLVQKILIFKDQSLVGLPSVDLSGVAQMVEKFRHRNDKMRLRETFPEQGRLIEKFAPGRKDQLCEHETFRLSGGSLPSHYVSTFYEQARHDGLRKRIVRELDLEEYYSGRLDRLESMKASFVIREKKFGPADNAKRQKQVAKVVETYAKDAPRATLALDDSDSDSECDEADDCDYRTRTRASDDDRVSCLGRVLDTDQTMERTFDVESERIVLKFHRIGGQILCKTVDFDLGQTAAAAAAVGESNAALRGQGPKLRPEDVKVYMVDPRQKSPCFTELEVIFQEQLKCQKEALARVAQVEAEMEQLLETRMKELSANDLTVWMFDIKRNMQVKKGRQEQERLARKKENDILDLELDFLAPYLERFTDAAAAAGTAPVLTRAQAREIRDTCLQNVQSGLKVKKDLEANKASMTPEDLNSKKFLLNVLHTRLQRQKRHTVTFFKKAEDKVNADPRIKNLLE